MGGFERTKSNIDRLQQIQDGFCEAMNVFAFCVDGDGHTLTHLSGDKKAAREIMMKLPEDRLTLMLEYVMRSVVEDRLVEEFEELNSFIGTLSVKINKEPIFSFIVFAEAKTHTEESVYKCLKLLHSTAKALYETSEDGGREFGRVRKLSNELEYANKKNLAIQEIVRYLDSDDGIENITNAILRIVSEFTGVSNAVLIRPNSGKNTYDVIGEYTLKGVKPVFTGKRDIEVPEFIKMSDINVSISSSTVVDEFTQGELYKYSIHAVVVNPLTIREKSSMLCVFCDCVKDREWTNQEIVFLNDVTKIIQNIINRRIQKNSLASSYASLEKILDHVGSAIFVQDIKTKEVLFTNSVLRKYFEKELREGMLGAMLERGDSVDFSYLNKDDKYADEKIQEIFHEDSGKWFDMHSVVIQWVDGRNVKLFALYDITDKKMYQARIEAQAKCDFLTGLFNRMSCENDLKKCIEDCLTNHSVGYVIYLDIDNFKQINDQLGHKYGDVLLKGVSHSLQRISGLEKHCYRMGGDEFIIIITEKMADRLEDVLDEIEEICSKPWYLKGQDVVCTMSIGVACFPEDADTLDELVKKADQAMYSAKKAGKNRMVRYDNSIKEE